MGYYKNGKYQYEPMDVQYGVVDQDTYDNQEREKQKKIDQNNAGGIEPIKEQPK